MDPIEITFIAAAPRWTWIEIIIFDIVKSLPKELFGEYIAWDKILTLQSFIQKFVVSEALDELHESKKKKIWVKGPIFPIDASESDENFKEYLKFRPARIMMTGDANALCFEMGEMLVNYFASYHITPKKLIKQEILRGTRVGKWLDWNLKNGYGIPTWLVMKLLEIELKNDKYAHRGYIINGFPIITDQSLQLLPPCAYDDDQDYEEEVRPDSTNSEIYTYVNDEEESPYMEQESGSLDSESSQYSVQYDDKEILNLIRGKEFVPTDDDDELILKSDVQQQLDFIYDLGPRPSILVYLDTVAHTQPFIDILKVMESFFICYRREMVIIIDCRLGFQSMYEHILNRLLYMNYKVNYPCIIMNKMKKSTMSLEELRNTDTLEPNMPWWISEFGRICPVSLYKGRLRICDSRFPVRYLKYIFLLLTSSLRKQFIVHPGKYLNIVPTCRLAIIGPHRSGKTTLSRILSRMFKADIYKSHTEEATTELLAYKDDELQKEYEELEEQRVKEYNNLKRTKIEEWITCVLALLNEIIAKLTKDRKPQPDLFQPKLAREYFEAVYLPPMSDEGIKEMIMKNAIYKRSLKNIKSTHFLNWVSKKSVGQQVYRQYVIDSAPSDIQFWRDLKSKDQLPDCVIFLKMSTLEKINDVHSSIHNETCINRKMLTTNFLNNFHNFKELLVYDFHIEPITKAKIDESTEKYLNLLNPIRFQEALESGKKYGRLQDFLYKSSIPYFVINISKSSWTRSIIKVIHEYFSLYKLKANALYEHELDFSITEVDSEEQMMSVTTSNYYEVNESEHVNVGKSAMVQFIQYGKFQDWCPVSFRDKNILLKGLVRYSAEYKNNVYVMRSRSNLKKFVAKPEYYTQGKRTIPPPRIYLTGLTTKAKMKFGETLSLSLNVSNLSCTPRMKPHTYNSIVRADLNIEDVHTAYRNTKDEFLKYLNNVYEHGVVVVGFPLTVQQFNDALEMNLYPEYVFIYDDEIDVLTAMLRSLTRQQTMHYYSTREWGSTFDSCLPEGEIEIIKKKSIDIIHPFLLEIKKIENICHREGISVIKVKHTYKYGGHTEFYVQQVNHFRDRNAFFDQVEVLTMEQSERYLNAGYYRISRFKYSCPVDVQGLIAFNRFNGTRKLGFVYPCVYRDFIYFISGQNNLKEFLKKPHLYVNTCNAPQMSYPMRISVFGPPKSGVTTICKRISYELGFKMYSKKDLSDESITSIVDLLKIRKNETPNGIVLDNFNLTPALLLEAAKNAVYMTLVLIILPTFKQTLENFYGKMQYAKFCPSLALSQIQRGYCDAMKLIRDIRYCNDIYHFNIRYVHGDFNTWTTWDKVKYEIFKTSRCISGYSIKLLKDRCASIGNLNLFTQITLHRRPINYFYCQVCLSVGKLNAFQYFYVNVKEDFYSDECQNMLCQPYGYRNDEIYEKFKFDKPFVPNILVNPIRTQTKFLMSMFQFKDVLYWSCSDHSIHFIMYAQSYYNDREKIKPEYIPFLVIGYKRESVAYNGYCPIEYQKGKYVKGTINISVYYRGKVYLLLNTENAIEFLSYPEKYHSVPFDPNLHKNKQEARNFYGINEVYVSKVLLDLVFTRPKHFYLTGKESAATFMAIKLKVKNAQSKYSDYWTRRVPVPDERFDFLCEYHKPASKVPAYLNVVDIAGLVKGAAEGQGLGNAFLSHISACDAIFHLCRAFEDTDVTHVEGEVDPVRDLEIISEELRLKDEEKLAQNLDKLEKVVARGGDKKLKPEYDSMLKIKGILVDEKKHLRFADWNAHDIETLNKYLFLTTKPMIYLVNLSDKDFIRKKNKWLAKIKEWVDKNDPGATIIPFSGHFEQILAEKDDLERKTYEEETKCKSVLDKIIVTGYKALQLEYFFTAGPDEVKAWTIQKGTKAPQAAGRIHTDFEKGFIMAEVMHYKDFKEEGTEAAVKAAGKYRQQGRNYVVEDGDIIFFKFNAGAGLKDAKKK